jgi:hypothetical protein
MGHFRDSAVRLLEIGVGHGGSLEVWRKYFGKEAVIFGIDINPDCAALDRPDLPVRVGSQSDPDFLRKVVGEMGGLDVVIDDGSHIGADQIASFETLFTLLSFNGVYIVEDLHTAYWLEYGGGVGRDGTIVSFAKHMIDDMNGWYHGHRPRAFAAAKEQVDRIAFYNGMVVVTKKNNPLPEVVTAGGPG